MIISTVEFPLVDTPPMWTLLLNGHFLPRPVYFSDITMFNSRCPQDKMSTTVDGSLIWTLLTRPLGFHIRGTLLYLYHDVWIKPACIIRDHFLWIGKINVRYQVKCLQPKNRCILQSYTECRNPKLHSHKEITVCLGD